MSATRLVWNYFAAQKWRFIGSSLLAALSIISTVSLLGISGWLISRAAQMPPIMYLNVAIVGVRTFALLRSVTRYAERLLSHDATFRSLTNLRMALYEKLEAHTPLRLATYTRGDLISRVVTDVDEIQNLPLRVVIPISSSIIASIFSVALMTWLLPLAGLWLALTLILATLLIPWITTRNLIHLEESVATQRGQLAEKIIEHFAGLTDISMLGALERSLANIKSSNDELLETERANAVRLGAANGSLAFLQSAALLSATLASINAVSNSQLSTVNMVVVSLLPLAVFESVMGLPLAVTSLARIRGSAQRLAEILQTEHENQPINNLRISNAQITVEDVSLQWPEYSQLAVQGISFAAPPKSKIGIVGPSGSGKSTIVQMLIKFLLPSSGKYLIDNNNIAALSGEVVRSEIVATGHDAHLFATSIRENLMLAATHEVSDEILWDALSAVELAAWVKTLPDQLDTIIGENGSSISGGQRQRLLMARMFVCNPKVWVLDEPTEHLDTELAQKMMISVRQKSTDSTLIVVSHRPADVKDTHEIVVLPGSSI